MRVSLLKIIHTTLLRRAEKLHYYQFPSKLDSLSIENPNQIQLNNDYSKIYSHFKHPIFIDYVPKYNEMENPELAWLSRYSTSKN